MSAPFFELFIGLEYLLLKRVILYLDLTQPAIQVSTTFLMHAILFLNSSYLFLQVLYLLVSLLRSLLENRGKTGHFSIHLLLQLRDLIGLRSFSLSL